MTASRPPFVVHVVGLTGCTDGHDESVVRGMERFSRLLPMHL